MDRIILASASSARQQLLSGLGLSFEVKPSDIDEENHPEEDPATRALHLARLKAQKCREGDLDAWVIGCDTLVVAYDGTRLEKPVDDDDVRRMMKLHSGHCSLVHSGLCLLSPKGEMYDGIQTSRVYFKILADDEIEAWVADDTLWRGSSGAFRSDGKGQLIINRLDGDWTSVKGLPVFLLGELFAKAGRPIQSFMIT